MKDPATAGKAGATAVAPAARTASDGSRRGAAASGERNGFADSADAEPALLAPGLRQSPDPN